MNPIALSAARQAAIDIQRAARRADLDRNQALTTAEINRARRVGRIGEREARALFAYHAQHRASVARDPEIPDRDRPTAIRFMDVEEVRYATNEAVTQLGRIDRYVGTRTRPPNTLDGVVTPGEVANYHPSRGRLQREAGPLVEFVDW